MDIWEGEVGKDITSFLSSPASGLQARTMLLKGKIIINTNLSGDKNDWERGTGGLKFSDGN